METDKEKKDHHTEQKPKKGRWPLKRILLTVAVAAIALVLLATSYLYAVSPAAIRSPKMEHLHFRLQIVVNGQEVDFAAEPFQTPYAKDQCTADLSEEPIHFHDQKGQFAHIHWAGTTGGTVLKHYGWNLVGGSDTLLGYRLDSLPRIKGVPIHGKRLPAVPSGAQYWVYTGDENGYQKRSINDFKSQELEKFFGKDSNFMSGVQSRGFVDWLFPKAAAHGGEHHEEVMQTTAGETEDARLTRINNLIGNVVIFVQKDEPTDAQIKARFTQLVPLSDSTCGG